MPYADGSPTPEEMYFASQGGASMPPPVVTPDPRAASYYGPPNPAAAPPPGPPAPDFVVPTVITDGPEATPTPVSTPAAPAPYWHGTPGANMSEAPSAPAAQRTPVTVREHPDAGPTPEDDAAFEAYKQGQASKPRVPTGGGAGSADPFGVRKAQANQLATYPEEAALARKLGADEAAKSLQRAERMTTLAREQQEDSAIEQETARVERETLGRHMEEAQRELDAVKERRVDPMRLMSDTGSKVTAVIGGLFGGIYQGVTKGQSNPFLDHLDRTIDREIRVQEMDLAKDERSAEHKVNLIGYLRNIYKDEGLARNAAKQMYYQSALMQIEAESANYDSQAIMDRAEMAANGISRNFAILQTDFAKQAAAQAAAAAAAARAQLNADREWALKRSQIAENYGKAAEAFNRSTDGSPEQLKAAREMADELAKLEGTMTGTVENLYKYIVDPKTGKVDLTREIPGTTRGDAAHRWFTTSPVTGKPLPDSLGGPTPESLINRNALKRLFIQYRKDATGVAYTPKEGEEIFEAAMGNATTEEIADFVSEAHDFYAKKKAVIQSANPALARRLEENAKQMQREGRPNPVPTRPAK